MSATKLALPFDIPSPRERAELILSQLDKLPTLPAIAAKLLAVTASEDASAKDVTRVIESDAALTAGLLRLAQRADKGIRSEGLTVGKVVTLLGFRAVRNAVLSLKLHETLAAADGSDGIVELRRELWKHSLAVACASELIAARTNRSRLGGDAFVCGLLHDLGKIALCASLPKSYARVAERAARGRICVCDIERDLFGLDHTTAGKRLAGRWKLPESIVECAWLHHHPIDALPSTLTHGEMVRIVHVADGLVRGQRIGFSGYIDDSDAPPAHELLGLKESDVQAIVAEIPALMEPYCDLVGLDDMTSAKLCAESLTKANQELARLNQDLQQANARLEVRSICFDLLGRFTQMLSHEQTPSDVCLAGARSFCEALPCTRALVLAEDLDRKMMHAGRWAAEKESGSTLVLDLEDSAHNSSKHRRATNDSGATPVDAHDATIWKQCFDENCLDSLWRIPVSQGGEIIGAVLFQAGANQASLLVNAARECNVLSHAIGLAVAHAQMRDRSERTTEEIIEAHRRLRQAQAELVRTRSVAIVGAMAGGAAHELGTPLANISGRAQLLRRDVKDPDAIAKLDVIIEQAQKAGTIATELMEFAKPPTPQPVSQPLIKVVQEASKRLRSNHPLGADQLRFNLQDPAVQVWADADQVRTILDAVLSNAANAISSGKGHIEINSASLMTDDTARIVVSDNGVGMTSHVLEHAMDPFFSSRPAGRGRGLGLSRAYRLVEINHGRLWLESTPHVGTTVTIELPCRAASS